MGDKEEKKKEEIMRLFIEIQIQNELMVSRQINAM